MLAIECMLKPHALSVHFSPMASSTILTLILVVASWPAFAEASKKFLVAESGPHGLNRKSFQEDIMNAMGSMLGCGGQATPVKLASIRATLTPMWNTLPKTHDRLVEGVLLGDPFLGSNRTPYQLHRKNVPRET